jgi:hypothetical protein
MTVHERDASPRSVVRLLTVSHYFETHRGGIEIVASSLARELANRGIDVTWMATDASPVSATTENVTRIALRASNLLERTIGIPYPLANPSAWRRIFRETKRGDAVLIHDGLYLTSVIAALAASWAGKPFIVVQHIGLVPYNNVLLRSLMSVANKIITRSVLKHADQIVFISEVTQRYFADLACMRPPRLIFNGLDTNVFNPPGNDTEAVEARHHFDFPPSGPIALFVGRFVEKKRVGRTAEPRAGTPRHHLRACRLGRNRSMQVEPRQCPRVHIALWRNSRRALSSKQHSGFTQRGQRVSARHPGSIGLRLARPLRFGNSERRLVGVRFRDWRAGRSTRSRANGAIVFSRAGSIACKAKYSCRTHKTFRVRSLQLLLGHRRGTIYQPAART